MKLKRRFPNYCTVDESDRTTHEVSTPEDLNSIPWVKRLSEQKDFVRLSASPAKYPGQANLLMAEFDKTFWVVGLMDEVPDFLPIWTHPGDKGII